MGLIQTILIILVILFLAVAFFKAPAKTFEFSKGLVMRAYDFFKFAFVDGSDLAKDVFKNETKGEGNEMD